MADTSGKGHRGSPRGGASNRRSDDDRGLRAQGSGRSRREESRGASSPSDARPNTGAANGGRNRTASR
jgi:hypothetical protein